MDELSAARLKQGLKTHFIGREIFYYPVLPSTMDAAREQARKGAKDGTVVIAGEQTAGRGRLNREWLSPKGNIALSIILKPDATSLPYLIMVASLAVLRSIKKITGQKAQIKWPNDILIDGKKVCGILIENELKGNKVDFCIVGIGINVTLNAADFPAINETAASVISVKGQKDLRAPLIRRLLVEFEKLYLQLPDGSPIFRAWKNNLLTIGKKVKASWGKQVIEGIVEDVEEDGTLLIRDIHGGLVKVVAGDVTLREQG